MTKFDLPDDPDAAHAVIVERLNLHDKAIKELQDANQRQDEKLDRIERNTSVLIDIFKAGRGTLKTAGWVGKFIVWIGGIASAIYALWYAFLNWPHKGG